ncbi:MAG: hypothetical protein WCC85_09765, partial [Candidatus Sulfotelmatobacter sp.]
RIFKIQALIGTRSSELACRHSLTMAYAPFHSRKLHRNLPSKLRQPESATAFLIKKTKDEYETRS